MIHHVISIRLCEKRGAFLGVSVSKCSHGASQPCTAVTARRREADWLQTVDGGVRRSEEAGGAAGYLCACVVM